MDNRYLRDRARRKRRDRRSQDYARRRDSMDYRRDSMDYKSMDRGYQTYDQHGQYMYPSQYGVGHYIYSPDDTKDYDDANEYHRDLEEWMHKLKRHDRFNLHKDDVLKKAKDMNVRFHDFDEMEFYITYLMLISDFKQLSNDPHQYLIMAKEWLEDDDATRRGSEKLCAYLYSIVLGDD